MPTPHEAVGAIEPGDGRDILVRRIIYPIVGSENPTDLVAIDPDSGLRPWGLAYNGFLFWYDATDTTTAHDGITCIVTFDALRYKRTVGEPPVSVRSKAYSNPSAPSPAPAVGEWFIVGPAPTGAWAGHADDLAMLNGAGTWVFVTPEVGDHVYVRFEESTYHFNDAGDWIAGTGVIAVPVGSVLPSQLKGGGQHVIWNVENQTTNTPPGSPSEGVQYIIGSSPTGAWAGSAAKIAHYENGAWAIYTPIEGYLAWDKSLNVYYQYTGSAWVTSTGQMVMQRTSFVGTGGTFTKNARCVFVDVHVMGGSGGVRAAGGAGNGGTSSFGAHVSATGSDNAGNPGTGSGGDFNAVGGSVFNIAFVADNATVSTNYNIVVPGTTWSAYMKVEGAVPVQASGSTTITSAGPGFARKRILAGALGGTETVTVGAGGGAGGAGGSAGNAGFIVVEEWILT